MRSIPPLGSTSTVEWLLGRISGADRAAAIMGDLTEMAAKRGPLWFWMAYARTLVSLSWRAAAAFVAGCAAFSLMCSLFVYWMHHTPPDWRTESGAQIFSTMAPAIAATTVSLWFALPFGLIRWGTSDRFVRLACALFALATPTLFFPPVLSPIITCVVVFGIGVLLFSPIWRGPAVMVVATVAAFAATIGSLGFLVIKVYVPRVYHLSEHDMPRWYDAHPFVLPLARGLALVAAAIVCSRMHALLLRDRPGTNSTPALLH